MNSNSIHLFAKPLAIVSFGVMLTGCTMPSLTGTRSTIPSARSQSEYLHVDFSQLISGAYVDELSGKFVVVQCVFTMQGPMHLPANMSPNDYVGMSVMSPDYVSHPGMLKVAVPRSMASQVFQLKSHDKIQLRGVLNAMTQIAISGQKTRTLMLVAHSIEGAGRTGPLVPPRTIDAAKSQFGDENFVIGKTTTAELEGRLGSPAEIKKAEDGSKTYIYIKTVETKGVSMEAGTSYRAEMLFDVGGCLRDKNYRAAPMGNPFTQ